MNPLRREVLYEKFSHASYCYGCNVRAPFSGFAQGVFGTGISTGLSGLSSPSSNRSACINDVPFGLTSMPIVYFGWLEHMDGSSWALQRQASKGTATWPLRGFWFGATKEVTFDAGPGFIVSGAFLSLVVLRAYGSPPPAPQRFRSRFRRTIGGTWTAW